MTTTIIGAGGGKGDKGSNRTPRTARDSLDSREFANVTEVIAEGPIEGLANGLQSVFLNDTALQNADGTYNFQDVDLYERTGTATQELIPLDSSQSTLSATSVNVSVTKNFPVTRTISDTSVDAVRIIITIPSLQKINNENGDTLGTSLQLKIAVKYTNISTGSETAYDEVIDDTIRGRTADAYNRQYEIRFKKAAGEIGENSTYTVKITRVTEDSNDQLLTNAFNWSSFTTVKFNPQTYANSALIGVRLDAQQFSSIPSRKYDIKGLKVQIPTGVTVDSDTGRIIYPTNFVWDGTFQAATWTACPAWLLYALMLNTRFGLGDHFDSSQLDKWAFFRASKHANELVSNGFGGGKEARFSCNATINSTDEAYNVINQLLSVMKSQGFWEDGSLTIAQDSPSDPVYNFNQSNVTEEGFSYTNASNKTKPTVVVVAYLDLVLKDRAYEVVKDTGTTGDSGNRDLTKNGEAKRGIIKKSVTAFGCTSRAQANRLGRWILYEENNSEVIAFTSNLVTAQLLKPGQIISVADPVKAGSRRAGRVSSATINSINIDDGGEVSNIDLANSPSLSVVLPDGTFDSGHTITSVGSYCNGNYWDINYTTGGGTITVGSNFQSIPETNSIWVAESSDLLTSLWRVIGIKEENDFLYTIEAVSYDPSKYDLIENNIALTARDTTNLNVIPDAPTNVQILDVPRYDGTTTKELQYELNGKIAIKITFHWAGVSGSDRYRVKWRHEDDNFTTQIVNNTTIDLMDVKVGTYAIQVSSISSSGILFSTPAIGEYDVKGLQGNPDDIVGLSMVPISETLAVLSWKEVAQLDVKLGGRIVIRHDPRTSGASWLTSNKIVDGVSGASTQKQVPLLAGTYFVKAQDYLGNNSTNPASFTTTLPETTRRLNVKTWSEETAFSGGKVNSGLAKSGNNLVLTPNPYVSSGYHNPFYVDGDEEGEYTFATTFDFGHSGVQYDAVLRKEVISNSIAATGTAWDSRSGQFDAASGKMDGDVIDEANVDLYVRTTPDDPSSSPTWGDWAEFEAAIIRARGLQVKAVITSNNTDAKVTISDLGATLDLLQRTDSASVAANTSASTGVYNVTFEKAFYDTPQVQITPNSSSSNLFVSVSSLSRTGFTATFNNGSNVDTDFMFTVTGFGRAI
jgi:predicted phage tail protein